MKYKNHTSAMLHFESFPWLRTALFFLCSSSSSTNFSSDFYDFSRLKVPAEAFCSCPSNKAEQQFKEKHLKLKTIISEKEEIKYSKQSNEMNTL